METTGRNPAKLIALACPACGADLAGLAVDRVFGCVPCRTAYSVETDGLRADPLVAWEPEEPGPHVFLPLWEFEVDASVAIPGARGGSGGAERVERFAGPRVWVTAFDLRGRSRFGDPGGNLTRRQAELRIRKAGRLPAPAGARLPRSAAGDIAPVQVLAAVDARVDVLGGRVDMTVRSVRLALVPFVLLGDAGVREPSGGPAYPPAAIPDLVAVRRAQGV